MLCDEPITRAFYMYTIEAYEREWCGNELHITHRLEYHTTAGRWMVLETASRYITIGPDGVRIYDDKTALPGEGRDFVFPDEEWEYDDETSPWPSYETVVFPGQRLVGVTAMERDDSLDCTERYALTFDDFPMELCVYDQSGWDAFEYTINREYGAQPVAACGHLLRRQCSCGGRGELLTEGVIPDEYVARCSVCHAATLADTISGVLDDWNQGHTPCVFDTEHERLARDLKANEIQYIALSDKKRWFLDDDLCESESIILCFGQNRLYRLSSQRSCLGVTELSAESLSEYSHELYSKQIRPSPGEHIRYIGFDEPFPDDAPRTNHLRLALDDTQILITAYDDNFLLTGISCPDHEMYRRSRRKALLFPEPKES